MNLVAKDGEEDSIRHGEQTGSEEERGHSFSSYGDGVLTLILPLRIIYAGICMMDPAVIRTRCFSMGGELKEGK